MNGSIIVMQFKNKKQMTSKADYLLEWCTFMLGCEPSLNKGLNVKEGQEDQNRLFALDSEMSFLINLILMAFPFLIIFIMMNLINFIMII